MAAYQIAATDIKQDNPIIQGSIFIDENGQPIIEKKIEPSIYLFASAFLDECVGFSSGKYGYTTQPDTVRVEQWRKKGGIFRDIVLLGSIPAYFISKDGEKIYIMDHAIHKLLVERGYIRFVDTREAEELAEEGYSLSQEFYTQRTHTIVDVEGIKEIIEELKAMYESGEFPQGFKFYKEIKTPVANTISFLPTEDFDPRKIQQKIIDQACDFFTSTIEIKREYLISAPTRSGKSFMSAVIAQRTLTEKLAPGEKGLVLIVSGVADVAIEWQETFQRHIRFSNGKNGKTIHFITRDQLADHGEAIIQEAYEKGADAVAVFFTLQDLSGSYKGMKNPTFIAHDFLKTMDVDLLIVDEAHYAAFTDYSEYRKVINSSAGVPNHAEDDLDAGEFEEAAKKFSGISPKIGTLYVSATPYKELWNKDRFSVANENMSIITRQDIIDEYNQWMVENAGRHEWENPCFGIPKRLSFAVHTGDLDISQILELSSSGKRFKRENAARSLIYNMFGYEYKGLGSPYPKIITDPEYAKSGMGNHLLIAAPSRAVADLIEKNIIAIGKSDPDFPYEPILISSTNPKHKGWKSSVHDIKRKISKADEEGRKTITITVDRMTTGVTVKEWDTIIILRQMKSAQKFDQLVGRNGTPFVVSATDESGETLKYVEKPVVAAITYAPKQMLEIALDAAYLMEKIHVENGKKSESLEEVLDNELAVNPIYSLSDGGDHMVKVEAKNFMQELLEASKNTGIRDAASNIPINLDVVYSNPDLLERVKSLPESAERVSTPFKTEAFDLSGNEDQFDTTADDENKTDEEAKTEEKPKQDAVVDSEQGEEKVDPNENKIRLQISLLLLVSALTPKKITSVKDLLAEIQNLSIESHAIARNVGLDIDFVASLWKSGAVDLNLDIGIQRSNEIFTNSNEKDKYEFAASAIEYLMTGYGKLSANEVPTSRRAARKLVDSMQFDWTLPHKKHCNFIDPASKSGILLIELAKEANKRGIAEDNFSMFAVATSGVAYELNKKVFSLMGWDTSNVKLVSVADVTNILTNDAKVSDDNLTSVWEYLFCSDDFDRIENKAKILHDSVNGETTHMSKENAIKRATSAYEENFRHSSKHCKKFDVALSNPPYQGNSGTAKKGIYPDFMFLGATISTFSSMIHPARAFAGAGNSTASKETVRKIKEDGRFRVAFLSLNSKDLFDAVDIKGGVMISTFSLNNTIDKEALNNVDLPPTAADILEKTSLPSHIGLDSVISSKLCSFTDEALNNHEEEISRLSSPRMKTNVFDLAPEVFEEEENFDAAAHRKILGLKSSKRTVLPIKASLVSHELFGYYKVFVPSSNGSGLLGEKLSTPVMGYPIMATTQTFLSLGKFETELEAKNLLSYIKTKFARMLLGTLKQTQHNNKNTWANIPLQDFTPSSDIDWSKSISEIDQQLYKKYGLTDEEVQWTEKTVKPME